MKKKITFSDAFNSGVWLELEQLVCGRMLITMTVDGVNQEVLGLSEKEIELLIVFLKSSN